MLSWESVVPVELEEDEKEGSRCRLVGFSFSDEVGSFESKHQYNMHHTKNTI